MENENIKNTDTIVAIATPLSRGAISIIRMSGKNAYKIAQKIINKNLTVRMATLCKAHDRNKNFIDSIICIYFKAPNSFNGEDIIEFQSHGGLVIAQEILNECIFYGARLALPGEFSKIALMNNKIDILQLQAITNMINNRNKNLNKFFAKNLNGGLKDLLNLVRNDIVKIIAMIEVNIDYNEEDLDENILQNATLNLKNIIERFECILDATKKCTKLQHLKLSIIGRANVGKSSILNLLLMTDRAITSDIEGTTRDVITEYIDINGSLIQIADTAGIRNTDDEIESIGIEKSKKSAENSDILLCVFDSSTPLQKSDLEILEFAKNLNNEIIIVLNKNDLHCKINYDFSPFNTISINALNKMDHKKLSDKIAECMQDCNINEIILMNQMQEDIFINSIKSLKNAISLLQKSDLELASYELNNVLDLLSNIIKPRDIEEILDSMFLQFCVGK